jgi:phosphohistidine phosphatase
MIRLLILRHAKAERDGGRDFDRRLTDRGRRDAAAIGRWVTAAELTPDLVVTSPAARAKETAEIAMEAGRWPAQLLERPALYDSSIERSLDVVRAIEEDGETLALVGHEPTWSALASILIGGGRLRLPTAGLACVEFELGAWADLAPGTGELRVLVNPGVLGSVRRR